MVLSVDENAVKGLFWQVCMLYDIKLQKGPNILDGYEFRRKYGTLLCCTEKHNLKYLLSNSFQSKPHVAQDFSNSSFKSHNKLRVSSMWTPEHVILTSKIRNQAFVSRNKPQSRAQFITISRGRKRQKQSYELLNYCRSRGHEQSALRMCAHFSAFPKRHDIEKISSRCAEKERKVLGTVECAAFKLCVCQPSSKEGKSSSAIAWQWMGKRPAKRQLEGFPMPTLQS